ncbi:hypothetical protein BIU88_12760 [Chlorobaculum limnaeum]|uniref:Low-complexity protein n=1 Tax=Chlorobaculum limnaeum TaxID=274537 RepID=A0A1D8D3H9_CHLLM|nr:pentapeptide repeat-containing protein [Chlorobaculum limnaeum]AOS84923.1 hypothetical protein BIU88_12760 [Chlorobaculum limnaeum]
MEPSPNTIEQTPTANAPDAQKLLESANSSSEQVGVLHLGFIAACAYVIVIAIGRTDLDLLIGKGIRLPIIDTEVPIIGFFAFAPWILVIVHFNLLLHLQLLARKLHAFDMADEQGKLRDQLRIFPITYFLVGKTDERTKKLLSLMVSITVILLPLITLLLLQLQFLAYQSEMITWGQRFAIWLDLALIVYFWPNIVELKGASRSIKERWNSFRKNFMPRKRDWIAPVLSGFGLMLVFCGTKWYLLAGLIALCLSALMSALYEPQKAKRYAQIAALSVPLLLFTVILKVSMFTSALFPLLVLEITIIVIVLLESLRRQLISRSSIFLIITGTLSLPLSLAFQVDGEHLEKFLGAWMAKGNAGNAISRRLIRDRRILNLQEQRLFANHPDPEIIVQLRSDEWAKALQKIEPLNLQGRSLRHANFSNALLCRADFRNADLKGADLSFAQLQGTVLRYAQLQGADLSAAKLQGADLSSAQLQGADLHSAQLQGADLSAAQLQGADLSAAELQGADLHSAQLQGADLSAAQLQGADLSAAELQGADLLFAQLQGAILRQANLYGATISRTYILIGETISGTYIIDAEGLIWTLLAKDALAAITDELKKIITAKDRLEPVLDRLQNCSIPNAPKPTLHSCLATDELPIPCDKRYDPRNREELAAFKEQLHPFLADLAAESPDIARSIISQIPKYYNNESSRAGLATMLVKRLDAGNAPGLQTLSDDEKAALKALAKLEPEALMK